MYVLIAYWEKRERGVVFSRPLRALREVYSVQNVQKVYVLLAYWEKRERGLCSLGRPLRALCAA